MSKAILMSIKPKWCELIASGKKTVEVRKTKPKLETPFKAYIYCTQGEALALPCLNNPHYTIHRMNNGTPNGRKMNAEERGQCDYQFANGKVIGEFVCDEISEYTKAFFDEQEERDTYDIARFIYHSQIKYDDLCDYVGLKDFYGWHISDLVIYDNPRELREFYHACTQPIGTDCAICLDRTAQKCWQITRPPQSWCYVEEGRR